MPFSRKRKIGSFVSSSKRRKIVRRKMRGSYSRLGRQSSLRNYHQHQRWCYGFQNANVTNGAFGAIASNAGNQLICSAAGGYQHVSGAMAFRLDDLNNVSEFTNLYEQYKITGIKLCIKLISNPYQANAPNTVTASTANYFPTIWYMSDYDDLTQFAPSGIKQCNRVKKRVLQPNRYISLFIKPRVLGQVTSNAGTASMTRYPDWLSTNTTDALHYGFKFVLDFEQEVVSAAAQWVVEFQAKYYVVCRNSR